MDEAFGKDQQVVKYEVTSFVSEGGSNITSSLFKGRGRKSFLLRSSFPKMFQCAQKKR